MPAQPSLFRGRLTVLSIGLCLAVLVGCDKEKPQEPVRARVQAQEVKTANFAADVALTGDV